jgi:hypothetical protein
MTTELLLAAGARKTPYDEELMASGSDSDSN